jgi:hypothetical protein
LQVWENFDKHSQNIPEHNSAYLCKTFLQFLDPISFSNFRLRIYYIFADMSCEYCTMCAVMACTIKKYSSEVNVKLPRLGCRGKLPLEYQGLEPRYLEKISVWSNFICHSWKKYLKLKRLLEISFHKGLLVGSDSRKNLSMGLLVSRDTRRPLERFFPSRVIKSLQCQKKKLKKKIWKKKIW